MSAWRRRAHYALSVLLIVLGCDLVSLSSNRLFLLGSGLTAAGVIWFARTLVVSDLRQGRTWRARAGLMLASCALSALALLWPAILVRVSSLPREVTWESYDRDLGWGNITARTVGAHFERIDPAREHVLVFGDSIIYGYGVTHEQTAVSLLARRFGDHQVLNAAISGYSIDQYAIYLRRLLPRTRPRLVVVGIFSGNDYELTGRDYGWGHSKPFFRMRQGRLVNESDSLWGNNCVDRLANSLLFRVLWRERDFAQAALDRMCHTRQLSLGEDERVITALLRDMDDRTRAAGARTLFMLMPEQRMFPDREGNARDTLYHSRYLETARLVREAGLDLYEPASGIAREGVPLDPLYLDDHAHFSVAGHALLARLIEPEIRARLGGPARPAP